MDNGNIVDAAYDFGDTDFAPPFDRPNDIAVVKLLDNNVEEFKIFIDCNNDENIAAMTSVEICHACRDPVS